MERIIEDVVAVVDGDWEMMAAVLVLELDAVRGVVGIGDFTVYVSDGDGCQGTTFLHDVDIARKEELGEVLGFLEGKHRGFNVILVGGLVIIEGGDTERGGSGTVEIELALGDASEMYVFIAVELIAHEQREVRRAVSDIERLGKKATMNGELEQSALAADAGFYSNRTYNVTYQGGVLGVHFSILDANHARCRLAIEESQALGVALQRDIRQVKRRKSLKRIAWNGEHRACGEEEQLYEAHGICGEAQTRVNEMALRCGRLFSLCVRRDDEVGEDTLLIQHVPLDDGASIIEHGDVVVRIKRSFKDSVRTTCDSDIYRSSIRRYFNLRWNVASEDVERRIIIDFQHDLFVFKDNRLCLYKKRPNRSVALHGSKDKGL